MPVRPSTSLHSGSLFGTRRPSIRRSRRRHLLRRSTASSRRSLRHRGGLRREVHGLRLDPPARRPADHLRLGRRVAERLVARDRGGRRGRGTARMAGSLPPNAPGLVRLAGAGRRHLLSDYLRDRPFPDAARRRPQRLLSGDGGYGVLHHRAGDPRALLLWFGWRTPSAPRIGTRVALLVLGIAGFGLLAGYFIGPVLAIAAAAAPPFRREETTERATREAGRLGLAILSDPPPSSDTVTPSRSRYLPRSRWASSRSSGGSHGCLSKSAWSTALLSRSPLCAASPAGSFCWCSRPSFGARGVEGASIHDPARGSPNERLHRAHHSRSRGRRRRPHGDSCEHLAILDPVDGLAYSGREAARGHSGSRILLALVGLVLIVAPWNLHGVVSSLLALAGAVCWAAGSMVAKLLRRRHQVDLLALTAWQTLFGSILLVVVAVFVEGEAPEWSSAFIWS